jgi:transcriptional regulator with XRE-family HTH domain
LDIIIDLSIFAEEIKEDMYSELYEKSGSEIIRELGKRYSDYRKRFGYTQKEVSEKSGLSVFTISSFENGSSTGITLASFIKLLRSIDSLEEIEKLLPELPESPRALFEKQNKK